MGENEKIRHMTKNNTLSYRVGQLEKCVDAIDIKMDKLLTNDIPHIQSELQSLKTRINVLTAINVGAIILAAALLKYL